MRCADSFKRAFRVEAVEFFDLFNWVSFQTLTDDFPVFPEDYHREEIRSVVARFLADRFEAKEEEIHANHQNLLADRATLVVDETYLAAVMDRYLQASFWRCRWHQILQMTHDRNRFPHLVRCEKSLASCLKTLRL